MSKKQVYTEVKTINKGGKTTAQKSKVLKVTAAAKTVQKSGLKTMAQKVKKAEVQSVKPYATLNETLKEIYLFRKNVMKKETVAARQKYFADFKAALAATAKEQKHFLLKILTENDWNDSEYLGLLCGIGLYVEKMQKMALTDMFQLESLGLCQLEEVIRVYSERKSKLFTKGYMDPFSSAIAISPEIIFAITGKQKKTLKEEEKREVKQQKCLSPVLKSVKSICAELSRYVVGQEKAKKVLATALFEHILRIRLKEKDSKNKFDKKNVLLLGPTGCGKTYLCQILAKIAGIPFFMGDSTQYSATGYHGGDVQDLITNLAQATNTKEGGTIPLSIVFIDEFDKLKFSKDGNGFDMTRKVQDNLLKMLECEKFYINTRPSFLQKANYYDISKVLFVASGAFSDLEESIKETKSIGFASVDTTVNNDVDVAKIAKYGFLPEILGRLTYRVCVDKLNKEQLTEILTKAEDNPIQQYAELYKECGKELVVPAEKISGIVDKALAEGTGARGLNNILGEYLREELSNMELPKDALSEE